MAQRALNANSLQCSIRIELAGHSEDRVQFQERERYRRIIQIDPALFDLLQHVPRQRLDVNLQSDGQRRPRTDARPDAAETRALDRLVQLQRATPERLVAERVESKGAPAAFDLLRGILGWIQDSSLVRLLAIVYSRP